MYINFQAELETKFAREIFRYNWSFQNIRGRYSKFSMLSSMFLCFFVA